MGGMRKTTVYMPDGLKSQLTRAAVESGRSEADLIREGIELVSGRIGGAEPHLPLFASGEPDLAERVDEHLAGFGER
jgi:Arc/MetJ-type ribon-helix-helix transcriptional regulator